MAADVPQGGGDRKPATPAQPQVSGDIEDVFEKIGVEERRETPMKLEFGLHLHNRIITYHATDSKA